MESLPSGGPVPCDNAIYFSDIFGFHPEFLKILQTHKGELGVLFLMKVTFGLHPRVGTGCQKDHVSIGLELSVASP